MSILGVKPGVIKTGRYDISIGIPDGDQVGADGFERVKRFTQKFTEQFDTSAGDVRFSMFKYNSNPEIIQRFGRGPSRGVTWSTLKKTSYSGGGNRIDKAVTFGTRMLSEGGRKNAKKSLVLLTTGNPGPGQIDWDVVSKARSGHQIIPVGIGASGRSTAQKISPSYLQYNTYNQLVSSGPVMAANAAAAVVGM